MKADSARRSRSFLVCGAWVVDYCANPTAGTATASTITIAASRCIDH